MPNQAYQALGGQGLYTTFPSPIKSSRAPVTTDLNSPDGYPYFVGQLWIYTNTTTGTVTIYQYFGSGNWEIEDSSAGAVDTLTDTTGTVVTPLAGNIQIAGTANQITSTAGTNKVILSLPSSVTIANNLTLTNGNLTLGTAGNKLLIATGTNAAVGTTAAMTGTPGTVTVTSTAVTALSIILYARATAGGTLGNVSISAQSAGSFTLLSTGNETSTFNYEIIN